MCEDPLLYEEIPIMGDLAKSEPAKSSTNKKVGMRFI